VDAARLEGVDAAIHLAGAGIGDKKWTPARKQLILESRTQGTDLLARTLAGLARPPRVLLSGSAVGSYGNRGAEERTEASALGADDVRGPVNVTAPNPVTNAEFTRALGAAVHRPTVLPTPLLPLKAVYGSELVQALTEGQRVLPRALEQRGYGFAYEHVDDAL